MQAELEKERKDRLYKTCKELICQDEWKDFEKEMLNEIEIHKIQSINFLAENDFVRAQRESWIIQGITLTIEKPYNVIAKEESFLNQVNKKYGTPLKNWFLGIGEKVKEKINN